MKTIRSSSVLFFTKNIKDFIKDDYITANNDDEINSVIKRVQQNNKSTIIVVENKKITGIITEQDIARRIVGVVPLTTKVKEVMTTPVITCYDYEILFSAIGKMRKEELRHLPVVNSQEEIVGMLTLDKALSAEIETSLKWVDDLTQETDFEGIKKLKENQLKTAVEMFNENIPETDVSYFLSFLNRIVYRRSVKNAIEANKKKNILHEKDIPKFCIIIMGSGSRMESLLHPDQDNGIIYELSKENESKKEVIDRYFYELAKEFTKTLDDVGIPFCKGNIMGTNPVWRKSLEQWITDFDEWINSGSDQNLLYVDELYDFSSVYGDEKLKDTLKDFILKKLEKTPSFFNYLLKRESETTFGLNWFGGFITEKKDKSNKGLLNIKHAGLLPLIESIRMYSIKYKVKEVSTLERLDKLIELKVFDSDQADFFKSGYKFLVYLLLKNQIRAYSENREIKNYINPKSLLEREKDFLKIYLRRIEKLKKELRTEFTGQYV